MKYLFFRKHIDIQLNDNQAIITASQRDVVDFEECKFLLTNGADVTARNNQCIQNVIQRNNLKVAKLFVKYGADISACKGEVIDEVCEMGYLQTLKWLLENGITTKTHHLLIAVTNNNLNMVHLLIHHSNADLNLYICLASKYGYLGMAELLIRKGADINTELPTHTHKSTSLSPIEKLYQW